MSPKGPFSLTPACLPFYVVFLSLSLQFFGGRKKVKAKVAEPPPQDPELEYKIAELEQLSETQVNDRLQAMLVSPEAGRRGQGREGGREEGREATLVRGGREGGHVGKGRRERGKGVELESDRRG